MAFPALLDTCVLYPAYLCDTLLRLAEAETFRPLWSDEILAELERNLVEEAGLDERQMRHRLDEMSRAFTDAKVTGYRTLVSSMTCNKKDRHVLAAAVRANVEALVTFNLRDFPQSAVDPYDIRVVHPDEFLLDQLDLHPARTRAAMERQASACMHPPMSFNDLLDALSRAGVPDFAGAIRSTPPG
jgi:predicted nucleic acid-binding protein